MTTLETGGRWDADLVVVGSGGAAMAAAIEARKRGARAILVERGTLGGTCVNRGCVPSKALLAAAAARQAALDHRFRGVPTRGEAVDVPLLVDDKDELITWLRQAKYADVAAAWGFEVLAGEARFLDAGTLQVDGRPMRARCYVVATGAQPRVAGIAGIEAVDYLTSTTAMELRQLPESLVVIGAGYVGMEQAQLFAHLGSRVTLVGRLAPYTEPELAEVMRRVFAEDGITVVEGRAVAAEETDGVVAVTTASGARIEGQRVLVATGRRPDTEAMGLRAGGIATDERGFVAVDAHQRTSNPRVFAAGDVVGTPQFVYVAAASGRVAAANALDPDAKRTVDYTGLPAVTFTRPQVASAGMTEADAVAAGYSCACRVLALSDVPRALVNRDTRGAVKLVADADSGLVLGVHAAAEGAGEMMLAATYAIKSRMTVDDLADTWAPYLTMAESLRLTAGLFRGELPTSCCA